MKQDSRPRSTASHWSLFLFPSFIWGSTWLVIKFQLGEVAPEVSVAYRFGLASLLLFGWCTLRGLRLRYGFSTHARLALLGLLQFGLNYVIVYLCERSLTSGLLAVVFVLMVAWNLAGAWLFFRNPASVTVVLGAALGMLGVLLVFWPELHTVSGNPGGAVAVGLAVLGTLVSSAGNLWSHHVQRGGVPVVPGTAWGMLYASLGVALYCSVRDIPFAFDASVPYVASLVYLALFGSVFAFIAYFTLIQRVGVGRAGYTAAAIPVLAMLTSTVFEGYRWSGAALAGMALVVGGNVMVLRGSRSPRTEET